MIITNEPDKIDRRHLHVLVGKQILIYDEYIELGVKGD